MTDRLQCLLGWKERQGLTLTELARQLNFDTGYMSRITNGERPVGDAFIGRFAQIYGYEVAATVFGNGQTCQAQP